MGIEHVEVVVMFPYGCGSPPSREDSMRVLLEELAEHLLEGRGAAASVRVQCACEGQRWVLW